MRSLELIWENGSSSNSQARRTKEVFPINAKLLLVLL